MNKAYQNMFQKGKLTLGIFTPIESYRDSVPTMKNQTKLIKKVEEYGFATIWVRDIPLHDPSFGDVGQMFDPFVYLAYLASKTSTISLATASIILPFRHPIEISKSIQSINNLSKGRLVLGIATGDRPVEYEAHNINFHERGEIFRDTVEYMNQLTKENFPSINSKLGIIRHADLLPKANYGQVPLLITGHSQQSIEWIAKYSDGWIYYPQNIFAQEQRIQKWKNQLGNTFKPFLQSLYIDLHENPDLKPTPIHLGFKLGRNSLIQFLQNLQSIGVNHIIINLKYSTRDAEEIIDELGTYVIPYFKVNA